MFFEKIFFFFDGANLCHKKYVLKGLLMFRRLLELHRMLCYCPDVDFYLLFFLFIFIVTVIYKFVLFLLKNIVINLKKKKKKNDHHNHESFRVQL
jgi:hypothetical protein